MTTSNPVQTRTIATKVGHLHVEVREARSTDGTNVGSGGNVKVGFEEGRGTILCWPSLFADARTLDAIVLELAKDYRVVVIDGPAHGKSGVSEGAFLLADCADAAMEVLDALGVEKVAAWIGAAWGGHVGVAAALRHASRIDSLVILNTPMGQWRGKRLMLMRLSQILLRVFGPRSFVARLIADKGISPNAGPDRAAIVALAEDALRRCDPQGLRVAMDSAMFGREDLIPRLPEIAVPEIIFFAGTDDGIFPLDEARAQAAAIPNCQFVAVESSAHHSAMERPDVVLPIVREALARRRATTQATQATQATGASRRAPQAALATDAT